MNENSSSSIWFDDWPLSNANEKGKDCIVGFLGIELIERGDDFLRAQMPVTDRVLQPAGVLHGGASVVLAETVGTWAAVMVVDREKFHCVGLEINANHVRPIENGNVIATARPAHLGRTTHVWQIEIKDEADKTICISRLTVAVLPVPSQY